MSKQSGCPPPLLTCILCWLPDFHAHAACILMSVSCPIPILYSVQYEASLIVPEFYNCCVQQLSLFWPRLRSIAFSFYFSVVQAASAPVSCTPPKFQSRKGNLELTNQDHTYIHSSFLAKIGKCWKIDHKFYFILHVGHKKNGDWAAYLSYLDSSALI